MANTREMPAMDQHPRLSLAEVLHSCKSYEEALSEVRHLNQADGCREDLPAWTPTAGSVLQRLTETVLNRGHLPDCCDLLQFQAIYANSGNVVDPKPLILSYLQFNSFSKTVVSLKAAVTDMKLFWQCLNWLLKCLLRNSRDALLRHLPEIGQELLCSVLDTSAHIGLRRLRIEELNDLLEVSSQEDRETFKKKCDLQVKDLCNLLKIAGNYDFQTSIVEAIFRLSTTAERVRCVSQWFPMVDCTVHSLFTRISDFEPDCRRFLNAYNAALGRYRLVYTFPCVSAFVGELQLIKPKAANYEKFWVDFNTACSSVLLFHQMMDSSPDQPWESLTVSFDDIKTVTLYRAVHSFRLVFVMKNVENTVTLFSSPLLQKCKDLVTATITLEFECSELLQKAAYLLYEERLNVISQEPDNLKYRKKHKKSKDSSSSGSGRKMSSSVVVPCTLEVLSTDHQVSARQQHANKYGGFLSSHSGHSSRKKTSISKQELFLDTEDTQFTPSEKVSSQESAKKYKASVSIMDIDACASSVRNEGITENTKASIAVVPCVSRIIGESDGKVQNRDRKEYIDSPHISGSLDRYLPTQDADLLNRAMDSYESKKQKKLDSSSESDKEIVPCSLSTQERWESHRIHVDLKSRKKQCQELPVVDPSGDLGAKAGSKISEDEIEGQSKYFRKRSNRNIQGEEDFVPEVKSVQPDSKEKETGVPKASPSDLPMQRSTECKEFMVSQMRPVQPHSKGREIVVQEATPNDLPVQGKRGLQQNSTECKEAEISEVSPVQTNSKNRDTVVPEVTPEATNNDMPVEEKRIRKKSSREPTKAQMMTPKTYPLRSRSKLSDEKNKDSFVYAKASSVGPKAKQRRSLGTSPKLKSSSSPNYPTLKFTSPMVGSLSQAESSPMGKLRSEGKHSKDFLQTSKWSPSTSNDKVGDNSGHVIKGETYRYCKSRQRVPKLNYSMSDPIDAEAVEAAVSKSPRPKAPSTLGSTSVIHKSPRSVAKYDKKQKISSPTPVLVASEHDHQKHVALSSELKHDKLQLQTHYQHDPGNKEISETSTINKSDFKCPETSVGSLPNQGHENSSGGEPVAGELNVLPQPDEYMSNDFYATPDVALSETEKPLFNTLQSAADTVKPVSSAIVPLTQESTPVTSVTAIVHRDGTGITTPHLHTQTEFPSFPMRSGAKWPDTPRPTFESDPCLSPLLMPEGNIPCTEVPNRSPDTSNPMLTGSFSAVLDGEVLKEGLSGSPIPKFLDTGESMSKSPVFSKEAQEKTTKDLAYLDHASDLRSGLSCNIDCNPLDGSQGKTADEDGAGKCANTGERNVYDTNNERGEEMARSVLDKNKGNTMKDEIEQETIPNASVFNFLGSGKSPSKTLKSTLKILAEYPVKPSGLKTPGKQFKLLKNADSNETRSKANTYPAKKKTKSVYPLGRSKSTSPTFTDQKECDRVSVKSKKKLYDVFTESMLIETPPENTSITDISGGRNDKELHSSEQKRSSTSSSKRRQNETYTVEKETSINQSQSTGPESFGHADSARVDSGLKDTEGKPKRGRGRPSLSSRAKETGLSVYSKSTKNRKGKRSGRTTEAGGFLEYPEIKDPSPRSHTVYSDFDFDSSHPETDHSWMYEKKKKKKNFNVCHTYKNRSKLRSLSKESSEDEWAPFKLRKKWSRKRPENLLSDSNNEENYAKKPRREKRPRNCQKRISYEEDTTDSEFSKNKKRHLDSSVDLVSTEKSLSWLARVERVESPELLRNTSRSSVDSGPPNILDFKLTATKIRDKDAKLQKIQSGIAESFGFSSQEENDTRHSKPVSKRIRKSVEDTQIKDMLQKILPQQEKTARVRPDPELLVNLSDQQIVPQPPNNTPVSMEVDPNMSHPFDADDPAQLILDGAANPDDPSEKLEILHSKQNPSDVDTTQVFDVGEISQIMKNKINFPNASCGPLQSTLIHESESCLVNQGRFSYVSEADNSYIEQLESQCSATGLNSAVDNEGANNGSPYMDSDANPWLRLDDSVSEDPDYERVSMIPRHPGSSPSDEGSPAVGENCPDCSLSSITKTTHTATPVITEPTIVPESVTRATELSPESPKSLPVPLLELYSRAPENPETCNLGHIQEAQKLGDKDSLEAKQPVQHESKSLGTKKEDYNNVISELAGLQSDTNLASQTTSKLTNILERLSSNVIEETHGNNLHTPCLHEEMLQKTPPRLVPRDLFNTTKGSGTVTDDANIKIMYDVLNTLSTPMSKASSALNRVVAALEEAKELLTTKMSL
ncbi:uncharacterized protein LOC125032663 [Penaeus chinensis]|uniref:uncharacterized protein LOC125032663 n=1 Tax=Penaeus chinensis TaxID=139456 RepID=UPI001FB5906C|nr:uncharacterized protein LOC125032663 [Penaeus chinensis]